MTPNLIAHQDMHWFPLLKQGGANENVPGAMSDARGQEGQKQEQRDCANHGIILGLRKQYLLGA